MIEYGVAVSKMEHKQYLCPAMLAADPAYSDVRSRH